MTSDSQGLWALFAGMRTVFQLLHVKEEVLKALPPATRLLVVGGLVGKVGYGI